MKKTKIAIKTVKENNTKNFGTLIVNLNDNKTSIDEISVPYQRQSIPQNYYQHLSLEMNE